MYTEEQRTKLLETIIEYVRFEPVFTGLLQIGSGAVGYRDIYSDIDLMAGCTEAGAVPAVRELLTAYFESLGAVYIDQRKWSESVMGLSVYFENGLSVDLSFMPTEQIALRSDLWRILISKTDRFKECLAESASQLANRRGNGLNDSIHHRFVYALRRCEIALCRGSVIYADMALNEARELLLLVQAAREGKKLHQFKDFDILDKAFLLQLETTFPASREKDVLAHTKNTMLELYLKTVSKCDFLTFDQRQRVLLDVFE